MSWRDVDSASETISVAGLAALVLDWRGVLPLAGDVVNALSRSRRPKGPLDDLDAPLPASSVSPFVFSLRTAFDTEYTAKANIAADAMFLAVSGIPRMPRSSGLRSATVTFCGVSFGPNTAEFGAFFSFFSVLSLVWVELEFIVSDEECFAAGLGSLVLASVTTLGATSATLMEFKTR